MHGSRVFDVQSVRYSFQRWIPHLSSASPPLSPCNPSSSSGASVSSPSIFGFDSSAYLTCGRTESLAGVWAAWAPRVATCADLNKRSGEQIQSHA
ncbi:MAG: hypothetical protein PVF53_19780, partial [Desulfobacterales bacterium]